MAAALGAVFCSWALVKAAASSGDYISPIREFTQYANWKTWAEPDVSYTQKMIRVSRAI